MYLELSSSSRHILPVNTGIWLHVSVHSSHIPVLAKDASCLALDQVLGPAHSNDDKQDGCLSRQV